jgi:hypothetical protein
MGQNSANIGLNRIPNELTATGETSEVPCRGGVNSALVRFADLLEAAVTVNALRRARS